MEEIKINNALFETETSQDLGDLALALSKAQGMIKPAKMNQVNPYFKSKYADLSSIIEAIREPLAKNELAYVQTQNGDGNKCVVVTRLIHKSGQWIKGKIVLNPQKNDPQGMGSAITYARRYSLASMIGVVSDQDDDGNEASSPKTGSQKPTTPIIKSNETIELFIKTENQHSVLFGNDSYKKHLQNKKGESPSIEQIKTWKSPKQIEWLKGVTLAMQQEINNEIGEPDGGES